MSFRCLVTGSRSWDDRRRVYHELDAAVAAYAWESRQAKRNWHFVVVHGANPEGADAFAHDWYETRKDLWNDDIERIAEEPHPADWAAGKQAGPRRNAEMVKAGVGLCLAFFQPDAENRGTTDCWSKAKAAGIEVKAFGKVPE